MSRMNDRSDKKFNAPFPQKDMSNYHWQDPQLPPLDPNDPPPRSGQKCANCSAFAIVHHPVLGPETICAAEPPKPICLGLGQTKTINAATGQPTQFPVIQGFQPPTGPESWCRCWEWVGPQGRDGQ